MKIQDYRLLIKKELEYKDVYVEELNFEENERLDKAIDVAFALYGVVDTLPADDLIKSLGEAKTPNEYILKTNNGVWWIEHKHVGSGEPLRQLLTDKPVSG